jgi:hypothetical protein
LREIRNGGPAIYSATINQLLGELYSLAEVAAIHAMAADAKLDLDAFTAFDYSVGGPSALTIADPSFAGGPLNMPGQGVGRYDEQDRDVFRPLQYCSAHLMMVREDASWLARTVVAESAAHVETLLKRVGDSPRTPLGALLRKRRVSAALDEVTLGQALRFAPVNNSAKHDFGHPKDAHMFSYQDALAAYFVCRRLALRIYPLATLATDPAVFDVEPVGFDRRTGHLRRDRA